LGIARKTAWVVAGLLLTAAAGYWAGGAILARAVHSGAVRRAISDAAAGTLGGTLTYGRLDVAVFPRPVIVLREVRLSAPGRPESTARSVTLVPAFVSLIRREVRLASVRIEEGDLRFDLSSPPGTAPEPFTLERLREQGARWLDALEARAPGLAVEFKGSRATFLHGTRRTLEVEAVDAAFRGPPGGLRAEISCASPFWHRARISARLDRGDLAARGTIRADGLALSRILGQLPPLPFAVEDDAPAELSVDFEARDFRSVRADVEARFPSLTLRRGRSHRLGLSGVRVAATIRADGERVAVGNLALSAGSPSLRVAGSFEATNRPAAWSLSLRGSGIDVASVRTASIAFAGDVEPVPSIFDRLRGGTVPAVAFEAHGRLPFAPIPTDGFTLDGTLRGGRLHVVPPGLDLDGVDGEVRIARGVLSARRVSARLGRSATRGGTFSIDLARGGNPFRADLPVEADLSQLKPVMAGLSLSPDAARPFDGIETLEGHATGRLRLDGEGGSVRTAFSVSDVRLAGRHRAVRLPIEIDGGRIAFEGDRLSVADLSGRIGRSAFREVAGGMRTAGDLPVDNLTGRIRADLGELLPVAASRRTTGNAPPALPSATGTVDLAVRRFDGSILGPGPGTLVAEGTLHDLRVESPSLPGPLSLASGSFRTAPGGTSFDAVHAKLLDAEVTVSGSFPDGPDRLPPFALSAVDGRIGPDAGLRLARLAGLPPEPAIRFPVALSGVRVSADRVGAVALAGNFRSPGGVALDLDLSRTPAGLNVRRFAIRDAATDAHGELSVSDEAVGLAFSGHLEAATLDRLLVGRPSGDGRISGDFRLKLLRGKRGGLSADGRIMAQAVRLPGILPRLFVRRLDATADGDRVVLSEAAIAWDDRPLSIRGEISNRRDDIRVDLSIDAPPLSLAEIARALDAPPAAGARKRPAWPLPVTGTLRIAAESFTIGTFTWKPVRATVALAPESVTVDVAESGLCGISMPGRLVFTPRDAALDFRVKAVDLQADTTLACLGNRSLKMTGRFSLDARVAGSGPAGSPAEKLSGPVVLTARDGRIREADLLMKVLAMVNVTQLFFGKLPDIRERGFAYDSLRIEGVLSGRKLEVREMVLDAASANIAGQGSIDFSRGTVDGVVLTSPFKTVDAVIRSVPVLRYIMKGRLLAVPVRVSGPWTDPAVSYLQPAEVGAGLLGVVERTLKLPVKLIEPILPTGTPGKGNP
jgi:hypothetical protein